MSDPRPGLGLHGEEEAFRHLTKLGYTILARRFRSRLGEIDLVAEDGRTLVFVEVKARRSLSCGPPEESVTPRKQRRLILLAGTFIAARGLHGRDCRFDVVAVDLSRDGRTEVRHLKDAFRA
jgi:putative endonuclease